MPGGFKSSTTAESKSGFEMPMLELYLINDPIAKANSAYLKINLWFGVSLITTAYLNDRLRPVVNTQIMVKFTDQIHYTSPPTLLQIA
jgi:hypothetical protein